MKGSKGTESVLVGAITLATEGASLVVSVEHDGQQYEVIREPWPFGPDDGQIYHFVTANGLEAIYNGEGA
jgi:hypothetical protein